MCMYALSSVHAMGKPRQICIPYLVIRHFLLVLLCVHYFEFEYTSKNFKISELVLGIPIAFDRIRVLLFYHVKTKTQHNKKTLYT